LTLFTDDLYASIFAGRPICTEPCADDYGADLFSVEAIN
jgi:hypothetical protein